MVVGVVEVALAVVVVIMVAVGVGFAVLVVEMVLILVVEALVVDMVVAGVIVELDREDIVDSVRGLKHRGGRPLNTGAALQYVKDNVFTTSSGSRRQQGVAQMLILLNGGRSFDNVDTPASALKQQGIIVIGIGTRASDRNELQKISYDPSYALSVAEFTDLPSVQEQLSSVLSTVRLWATTMPPTVTGKKVINFYIPRSWQ